MDKRYWDRLATDYTSEIFDSFSSDRTGVLSRCLDTFADRSAPAADAGCGVGKYLPALAMRFATVDAYDLSGELLKQARIAARGIENIRYFKRNLASRSARVFPVRFALCANVLIMPDQGTREGALSTVARMVERGGHAVFLIPSVESAILTHHRLMEWHRRDGMSAGEARRVSAAPAAKAGRRLADGLVPIARVPTKHYLREEAVILLRRSGFEPVQIEKVEYGWETEFDSPPEWMGDPFPWDWLASAKRN